MTGPALFASLTASTTEVHVADDGSRPLGPRSADAPYVIAHGFESLLGTVLLADPPRPEELTNAIGLVADGLDDLIRVTPEVIGADLAVGGEVAAAIAAVEAGHEVVLPVALHRAQVEEVFRTVATEPAGQRRLNPGLPSHLVGPVLGASCIMVGMMRRLHVDAVVITDGAPTHRDGDG